MSTISSTSISDVNTAPVALQPYPTKLFIETSSRCNLSCAMCVKQNRGSELIDGDFPPELFEQLLPALPHLQALVLNGVGEPLLNPRLETYIRNARRIMPPEAWIGFQTNGLLMTDLQALALVDAGLDRVCVSVDASTPETFMTVREGGTIAAVERALEALTNARRQCNRPDLQIGIEFVAMNSTIADLPATLEWAAARGVTFAIVTHMLPYDQQHDHEALYCMVSDQALEIFARWRRRATEAGLDLNRYAEARNRYTRSADDVAILALVKAMKADAEQQDVMLDVKKLIAFDHQRLDQVAELFEAAQAVADRTGLDLRLPSLALKEQRSCSFVEDGSAFVSWSGNVSPCYFLWHRYECFASGWQQQVAHKSFGTLQQHDLLEIWNNPEFTAFRKDVLGYEYSSCASCGLSPCDYVQTAAFEQDCHVRTVPCGACLWCTGVFQCLR